MENSIEHKGHATIFAGPKAVNVFRCTVIASALKLYAATGMQANRAYTPSAMLKAAFEETGIKFKRGQYLEAAEAMRAAAARQAAEVHAESAVQS